jgi:hypothetical protein
LKHGGKYGFLTEEQKLMPEFSESVAFKRIKSSVMSSLLKLISKKTLEFEAKPDLVADADTGCDDDMDIEEDKKDDDKSGEVDTNKNKDEEEKDEVEEPPMALQANEVIADNSAEKKEEKGEAEATAESGSPPTTVSVKSDTEDDDSEAGFTGDRFIESLSDDGMTKETKGTKRKAPEADTASKDELLSWEVEFLFIKL